MPFKSTTSCTISLDFRAPCFTGQNYGRIPSSSRKAQPKRNKVSVRKIRDLPFMKTNIYFEEKRTDVNIATEMLHDAYTTDVRAFALISGDSDFTAPLNLIRKELNKQVIVLNPKDRPTDLRHHSSVCIDIPRDLPAQCQLPDEIPVGTHGRKLHRPPSWTIQPA